MVSVLTVCIVLSQGSPNDTRHKWLPVVKSAAQHYDLDWRLLDALIYQESAWNPYAVSAAGARGLAQLMPDTARELKVVDVFDAGQNIWGAAWYLRQMYDRFDSWHLALAAYNAGPTRVARCRCIPPFPETTDYVRNVLGTVKGNQDGQGEKERVH